MSGETVSYGLESIVLHHSFKQVRGRTIKIDCRERTHLGGVNGAGKTSVLALVPAFFGEEPERIVTKASGKLSFLDYYLPTFQSLIIFEYRRHTGLYCAVMYRHAQGKPCYRFVAGSAEETFFAPEIKELLQGGASADDVFAAIRRGGTPVSKIIDTITNYRAIIQRNQKLLKRLPADARSLRALAAEFGLGDSDTQMTNIERLTHVVLNKHRLLSSFKTMICETQFENIHQHARPRAIDRKDLIADIQSLSAFAGEEEKIRECLRKDAERRAILEQADKTVANLFVTVEEAREKASELSQQKERFETERSDRKTVFEDTDHQLARQVTDHNAHFETLDGQVAALHRQNDQYEVDDLPGLAQRFDNLADYRQRHATAQADYDSLTGKASAIEGEYDLEKQSIQREHEKHQAQREQRLREATDALTSARHAYDLKLNSIKTDKVTAVSEYKDSRAVERSELTNEQARLSALRESPGQTEAEQQEVAFAEQASEEASEQVAQTHESRLEAGRKRDQADHDWKAAQEQVQHMDVKVQGLEDSFNELQKQIAPENGTWLSQLRAQDPEWGNRLAKVVNPSLLHRKDLTPTRDLNASETAVMGWQLALDAIPVPDFAASEDALQERSRSIDAERQGAIKQRADTEREAQRRHETYKARAEAADRLETEFSLVERTRNNAQNKLGNARQRVKEAQAARIAKITRDLDAVQLRLKDFDEQTGEGIRDVESGFQQQMLDMRGHWAEQESEHQSSVDQLSELIASAESEHKARLKKKRQIYDQRLSEEGIDPKVVQDARDALAKLTETVEKIVVSEDLVRGYRKWREQEWSKVEALTEQASQARAKREAAIRKRDEAERTWKEHDSKLKASIAEHQGVIKTLREQTEAAEGVLKHFRGDTFSEGFPGNLADLTQELQGAYQKLEQLRKEVVGTFDQATSILNRYDNTQIQQAWQKLSAHRHGQMTGDVLDHEESFKLARVPDLRELLDTDIPQLRDALIDQFVSEAGSLVKYFDSLEVMAREVKAVSSLLKRKINTDQQIESLSDIQVVLEPRIYEDETWQPLKEFVEQWQTWIHMNRRSLPSDAILRRFKLVTDTLSDAKVKESVESMIDMRLEMKENDRQVVIRTDADFLSASSTGLTYLAIMTVFMGLTRYLCPDLNTRITWPIDELATLSPNNISHLADMLEANNLTMISACPKLDRSLRKFFENKISLKQGRVHTYETSEIQGKHTEMFASVSHGGQTPQTTAEEVPSHE
ncbi:ATP-binding protein [Marinobacter antarcticus]|uniref:ATP-binding protein n=1 Tax=Marinobacter antarcticus TaxID=564117 RepID=UPI0015873308|nr:ATP-binding protein [Marinobacter antarcticus]